ncbi:hypothetical protein BDZ89DRAFT_578714 [Hymenopellis radicata]|nr:hypothetical protein BDZ89DRAFT_578714 [Hymenopellis radicata]
MLLQGWTDATLRISLSYHHDARPSQRLAPLPVGADDTTARDWNAGGIRGALLSTSDTRHLAPYRPVRCCATPSALSTDRRVVRRMTRRWDYLSAVACVGATQSTPLANPFVDALVLHKRLRSVFRLDALVGCSVFVLYHSRRRRIRPASMRCQHVFLTCKEWYFVSSATLRISRLLSLCFVDVTSSSSPRFRSSITGVDQGQHCPSHARGQI